MKESLKKYPLPLHAAELADRAFDYGDLIPWAWLHDELEIEMPDFGAFADYRKLQFKVLSLVDEFREALLLRYFKATRNERGEGYRIIRPNEQTEEAMRQLRQGIGKDIAAAARLLAGVNHTLLSAEQSRDNANALGKVAALQAFARETVSLPSGRPRRLPCAR
ncbi:MAG TPA: hypothetical protein PKY50_18975 [Candidatus Competibacter sp.]|nr:hypothetical protein [Candidatus Competibacter sp.]